MSTAKLEIPKSFPPFDLTRLLKTVFEPQKGERTCVLIDLDDPAQVKDFAFLQNPALTVQKYAHDIFYQGLNNGVGRELGLTGGELYAYKKTGGSNLDMDDLVIDTAGHRHGIMGLRWVRAETLPAATTRVVPLAELRSR